MSRLEKIGSGRQKKAYLDHAREGKVISFYREKLLPEEAKSVLYLNRLARAFFPEAVIHIDMAGVKESTAYQESKYVPHDSDHRILQESKMGKRAPKDPQVIESHAHIQSDPQLRTLVKKAEEVGLLFDPNAVNYIRKSDGSLVYTDFGPAFFADFDKENALIGFRWNIDLEELPVAIARLEGAQKIQAQAALDRILSLAKELQAQKGTKP